METKELLQSSIDQDTNAQRSSLLELICRWGTCSSYATLDPACKFFTIAEIDGVIGYRIESECAIVFGDPICEPEKIPYLANAFHEYCQKNHVNVTYLSASERFAKWAIHNGCKILIEVGEEIVLCPQEDPQKGGKGEVLRNMIHHALNFDVTVKEYRTHDAKLEHEIQQAAKVWLQARKGPQIYLAHLNLFEDRPGKRWFYAQVNGQIVGLLVLNRLDARQGWLIRSLMSLPKAPRGTSEYLVTTALEILHNEDCRFLNCGMIVKEQLGEIEGLNGPSLWLASNVFRAAKWFFSLNTKRFYWKKFHPQIEPTYLLFSNSHIGLKEIYGLKKALNVSF